MMDKRIDAWLDDELGEDAVSALLAEAEARPELHAELERAAAVRQALRSLPQPSCPPEVAARVKSVARRQRADRRPWQRMTRVYAPVGVAAALILASLFVLRPAPPAEPEPTAAEVQRALDQVQWAFAVVADVGHTTGVRVRDEVFLHSTIEPVRRAVRDVLPEDKPSDQ